MTGVLPLRRYQLRKDRFVALCKAEWELKARGLVAADTYHRPQPGSRLAREIGRAYVIRCKEAGREPDVAWFNRTYAAADLVAVLRIGAPGERGRLAAWTLGSYGDAIPPVLPRRRKFILAGLAGCAGLAAVLAAAGDGSWPWTLGTGLSLTGVVGLAFAAAFPGEEVFTFTAGQMAPGVPKVFVPGWLLDQRVMRRARRLGFGQADFGPDNPEATLIAGATAALCPG